VGRPQASGDDEPTPERRLIYQSLKTYTLRAGAVIVILVIKNLFERMQMVISFMDKALVWL
jgi:hypothetical protein